MDFRDFSQILSDLNTLCFAELTQGRSPPKYKQSIPEQELQETNPFYKLDTYLQTE